MSAEKTPTSHSPTPWFVQDELHEDEIGIAGGLPIDVVCAGEDGTVSIIDDLSKANAAFIVKAVNCHDELVAALRKLANESAGFWAMADPEDHGHTNMSVLRERVDQAFAALAKAEAGREGPKG